MAPVGNNGPYIPRLDVEQNRKSSLAIRNVTPLNDVTNVPATRSTGRNAGSGRVGGAQAAPEVDSRDTSRVSINPLARKRPFSDVDHITVDSTYVRGQMEKRRKLGTLPKEIAFTGEFPEHPKTEFVANGRIWSQNRQGAAAARMNVTASGLYEMTGALQEEVPLASPVAKPKAKRGYGLAVSR